MFILFEFLNMVWFGLFFKGSLKLMFSIHLIEYFPHTILSCIDIGCPRMCVAIEIVDL